MLDVDFSAAGAVDLLVGISARDGDGAVVGARPSRGEVLGEAVAGLLGEKVVEEDSEAREVTTAGADRVFETPCCPKT